MNGIDAVIQYMLAKFTQDNIGNTNTKLTNTNTNTNTQTNTNT